MDMTVLDAEPAAAPARAAELRRLASQLLEVADRIERTANSDTLLLPLATAERYQMTLLAWAQAEFTARRKREAHFKKALFGEPAWDILLDLFVREAHGTRVPITGACKASGMSKAAALRWLDQLEGEGLIAREPSSDDRRMRYVMLTEKGREALSDWLLFRAALPA